MENEQIASYLNLSVSLDPPIELQTENPESYYPGYENFDLLEEGSNWVRTMRIKAKKFKNPNINIFGVDIEGRSIFIPRYLTPLQPPPEYITNIRTNEFAIEKAARFVSMCPFIEDLRMFNDHDLPDLFTTC